MIPGIVAASLRKRALVIGDPLGAYVRTLLNAAGSNGQQVAIDETERRWRARGDFRIDTSPGHNVMRFDGDRDVITTPYDGAEFDWFTDDFTIDAVVNPTTLSEWSYFDGADTPAMLGCCTPGSVTNYWSFGPRSDGTLCFYYFNGSGAVRVFGGSVQAGVETHIRMTHKVGEGVRLFVSESLVAGPAPVGGSPIANVQDQSLAVGWIGADIRGDIRALRITKGAARSDDPGPAPWPSVPRRPRVVTWNPDDKAADGLALTGGNLVANRTTTDAYRSVRASHPLLPGRCCEFYIANAEPSNFCMVGVSSRAEGLGNYAGHSPNGFAYYQQTGVKTTNGSNTPYGPTWTNGNRIGMARIGDGLYFWINGEPLGLAFNLPAGVDFYPVVSMYRSGHVIGLRATAATMSQLYGGCEPMGS